MNRKVCQSRLFLSLGFSPLGDDWKLNFSTGDWSRYRDTSVPNAHITRCLTIHDRLERITEAAL